ALVEELLVDCAKRSDLARQVRLDRIVANGGPANLADIIRLLVEAEASLSAEEKNAEGGSGGHTRFIMALQINHRSRVSRLFSSGHHSDSYRQCVEYIRRFLADLPPQVVRDRLILMYLYIISTLSAREAALDHNANENGFWTSQGVLQAIAVTACAMLTAPYEAQP
ncbi:hypothetical protein, partial [Blastomonas fulva]|uniref:hypothetical protein n=1 Tax=Blastomonas fulva TaxID=1550728 RepID=UPI003F7021B7